jgi:hypothetical protein
MLSLMGVTGAARLRNALFAIARLWKRYER